ncbi:VWA domain-containing protein, partial [Pseudomonas sp. NPDC007930]|uniref:VWA domain-containing protein n=1 Tax=Pseudomonas sp. NPDC007930 TaxID=3364417 RepID=UPI0036ECDE9D
TQTVSYSYTLNDREQHPAGSPPADELSEDFHVIATDTDGDKADAWLNVRIEDDSPTARDDSNRHTVDAKHASTSGNVLLNDTLGADYNPQPVTNAGTLKGTYGTLQLNTDGTYTYTLDTTSAGYKALAVGALGHETFDYSIKDLDGDTSSAQLTLNVKGGDHPISLNIECDTLTVQESALPGGSHSNVDGRTVDGTFQVEAGDGVKTLVVGGITVVSNGEPVNFGSEGVSAKTEYGTFTVTGFDKGTGTVTYHYTLETAADHPAAGHDSVYDNIAIVATDSNNDQATGTLHMNIVDDTPSANSGSQEVHTGSTGTNLLLVVDVSNSMNTSARVGDGSQSRLDLTKAAIDKLLAEYANVGDVRVQIVAFSTEASQVGSDWMTVSQAEKYVASLSASGGTNYDYALDKASDVWSAEGKLAGAQNVSYFFSDGNPTLSDSNPLPSDVQNGRTTQPELGDGISESEQLAWEGFLRDHDIKSYAVGLGKNVAATYLEPIAYDGSQNTDLPAKVVTNLADLPAALISTVTGDPVSGTLVGEGGFGADGGHVQSITLDGIRWTFNPDSNSVTANGKGDSFTFDPNTSILTIKTAHGGELQVDMATGDYRYAVGSGSTGSFSEKVSFILEDGDHDTVSSAISIKVSPSTAQPGDDFTAQSLQRVLVHGQDRVLERSEFAANSAAMIATLLVAGVVGGAHAALASDTLQVSLHQGETVNLSQLGGQGHAVKLSLVDADGDLHALKNGQFTASEDGLYQLRVEPAGNGHAEQNYTLKVAVDYSHVETSAQPTVQVQAADDSSHHASVAHASAAAASTADAPASSGEHSASYQGSEHGVQADLREASFNTLTNLLGSQHDDWLHAGDNGSTLNGGAGNDTLVAGKGSDVLTGGSGADTFVWEHGASGHDVVTDFKAGVDTLDLSQLLGDVAKNASLDDFFKVSVSGSGSDATTHLAVSTSANGPAAQTIDLQHTNLAEQYHAGTSAGSDGLIVSAHDVINGMLGDHSLKVDAV